MRQKRGLNSNVRCSGFSPVKIHSGMGKFAQQLQRKRRQKMEIAEFKVGFFSCTLGHSVLRKTSSCVAQSAQGKAPLFAFASTFWLAISKTGVKSIARAVQLAVAATPNKSLTATGLAAPIQYS